MLCSEFGAHAGQATAHEGLDLLVPEGRLGHFVQTAIHCQFELALVDVAVLVSDGAEVALVLHLVGLQLDQRNHLWAQDSQQVLHGVAHVLLGTRREEASLV